VQNQNGISFVFGQWPTSSRTRHCPGSLSPAVGDAVRLKADPFIGSLMAR
jgi:hypothetical protein